jgi:inhibitor of KinA sporulation pathway (predicted exonuclease)
MFRVLLFSDFHTRTRQASHAEDRAKGSRHRQLEDVRAAKRIAGKLTSYYRPSVGADHNSGC